MKSLKAVIITGTALAVIAGASAIGYYATREELPQTTPIGYNIDAKQINGYVDVKGLANYLRNSDGEILNNFADTLVSGDYGALDLKPLPEGNFSATLSLLTDGRGPSLPLNEHQTREVLRYFRDFEEGIDSGRERYVPISVVRQIIENHGDFPQRLEGILSEGTVISNSCGSDSVTQIIEADNGYINLQDLNVSVVNDTCSLTSNVTELSRKELDNFIITSAQ